MATDQGEGMERFVEDGTLNCPICQSDNDPAVLRDRLSEQRIGDEDFAKLCEAAREGKIGLILQLGLYMSGAIEEMGEPTVEFQENFDRLEAYLEKVESTADSLKEEAEEWRDERDQLQKVKDEIDELEKEQLPEAVQAQLESLGQKVEGQLSSVDEKLSELTTGSYHSGTQQEFELAARARNLNLGDEVIPKGGRSEEDLTIRVKDEGEQAGTIVIESKNVKDHKSKHIEQLEGYKQERDAEIGLLVTTDMPSRSRHPNIDYKSSGEGVLILRPEAFEVAYLLARYALLQTHAIEVEYQEKQRSLETERSEAQALLSQIIEEIDRETVTKDLEVIIDHVKDQNEEFQKIRDYNKRKLNDLREQNRENVLERLERSLREVRDLDQILTDDR